MKKRKAPQTLREYYEASNDQFTQADRENTRVPKLTLRHLNKIRKMRELEKIENAVNVDHAAAMYGSGENQEEDL